MIQTCGTKTGFLNGHLDFAYSQFSFFQIGFIRSHFNLSPERAAISAPVFGWNPRGRDVRLKRVGGSLTVIREVRKVLSAKTKYEQIVLFLPICWAQIVAQGA